MKRAVFLDRDGVINEAVVSEGRPYPPRPVSSYKVIEGVPEALVSLRQAGFLLVVVTNQPDVARGTAVREEIEAMHQSLLRELALDEIVACYHDGDACDCRKPKPGALLAAAERHAIDLGQSYMVGDRWRDIEAGQRAGCRCFFIDYGYRERQPDPPFLRVTSLGNAAHLMLSSEGQGRAGS